MILRNILFLGSLHLLVLMNYSTNIAFSQDKNIPLQHIVFRNQLVADKLADFLLFTKAPVVYLAISMHRYGSMGKIENNRLDTDPFYKIEVAMPYRDYIEKSPPSLWAEWKGHLIVLRVEDELNPDLFYNVTDKTTTANLIKFIRRILPKLPVHVYRTTKNKTNEIRTAPPPPIFDGAFWEFKVMKEKAIFFNGNHIPHDEADIDSTACRL